MAAVEGATRASDEGRLPDFFIPGVMKGGTSTLAGLLAAHPDVYMPRSELCFFDVDDLEEHPEFYFRVARRWVVQDLEGRWEHYLRWYQSQFAPAEASQLAGDESVSYICSRLAPARIARLLPNARFIVVLRDPVERTYSHYWHLVQVGQARYDFETTLMRGEFPLLRRSCYRDAILRYLEHFSREQMLFVLTDDLRRDPQGVADRLCDFLGVARRVDVARVNAHRNRTDYPLWPAARRVLNRALAPWAHRASQWRLPVPETNHMLAARLVRGTNQLANRFRRRRPPPMRAETRRFLEQVLARKNAGLGELLNRDLSRVWTWF